MTDDWSAWDGDPDDTADLGGDGDPDLTGPDDDGGAAGFGPADADYGTAGGDGYGPDGADADPGDGGDLGPDGPAPDPVTDPTAAYGVDPYGDDGATDDPGADGATDEPGDAADGEAALGPADLGPVGADPDVDPYADGTWPAPAFPEAIDVGPPPEPVDGFPWVDPATLGDPGAVAGDPTPTGDAAPADLAEYAALDPGTPLTATDDPATAALARFWNVG